MAKFLSVEEVKILLNSMDKRVPDDGWVHWPQMKALLMELVLNHAQSAAVSAHVGIPSNSNSSSPTVEPVQPTLMVGWRAIAQALGTTANTMAVKSSLGTLKGAHLLGRQGRSVVLAVKDFPEFARLYREQ